MMLFCFEERGGLGFRVSGVPMMVMIVAALLCRYRYCGYSTLPPLLLRLLLAVVEIPTSPNPLSLLTYMVNKLATEENPASKSLATAGLRRLPVPPQGRLDSGESLAVWVRAAITERSPEHTRYPKP